jgi:hypothetical protein
MDMEFSSDAGTDHVLGSDVDAALQLGSGDGSAGGEGGDGSGFAGGDGGGGADGGDGGDGGDARGV